MPDSLEEKPTWTLLTVDDVDELVSDLLYMPPRIVAVPDGTRWEVWAADIGGLRIELRNLDQDALEVTVANTLELAFVILQGGEVEYDW